MIICNTFIFVKYRFVGRILVFCRFSFEIPSLRVLDGLCLVKRSCIRYGLHNFLFNQILLESLIYYTYISKLQV
ncbi:hypothetical protein Glove_680g12 [Diversispora epigaea]|uniref:Uncharacterized protein n=1 Tax=Diversispora epigaea TaxID=1348612 RepID=A0A397G913_9GLOM|nr:hypothetical protein Glove_680g12 [Diversispora epigaea]